VNAKGNGSSALHAAVYFGQEPVVRQLIALGASVIFRNLSNSLPVDEAKTEVIKDLILKANDDDVAKLLRELKNMALSRSMETIVYEGAIVGYRAVREIQDRRSIRSTWKLGWHGTTRPSVLSIFQHGLRKPGEAPDGEMICERAGHVASTLTVNGIHHWSRAVFMSPVLTYDPHPFFAQRIKSKPGSGERCFLVQAYGRSKSFTTHSSMTRGWSGNDSEESEEIRVDPCEDEKVVNLRRPDCEIVRVPDSGNVTVVVVLLGNDEFIQKTKLSAKKLSHLMQGSDAL
jgi:hypothetical protein